MRGRSRLALCAALAVLAGLAAWPPPPGAGHLARLPRRGEGRLREGRRHLQRRQGRARASRSRRSPSPTTPSPTRSPRPCRAARARTSSSSPRTGWAAGSRPATPSSRSTSSSTRRPRTASSRRTLEAMTYRGTLYGLPLNYKVITLIYNKKLVNDAAQDHRRAGRAGQGADRRRPRQLRPGLLVHRLLLPRGAAERLRRAASSMPAPSRSLNAPENVKALELLLSWIGQGRDPAGRAVDRADHLAVQRGQGGDGLLRPVVPGRDRRRTSTTAWRRCRPSTRPAASRCAPG